MFSGVLLLSLRPRSFNVARSDASIYLGPVFVCVFTQPGPKADIPAAKLIRVVGIPAVSCGRFKRRLLHGRVTN